MAVSYPLSIPGNFSVKSSSFRLRSKVTSTQSAYTFSEQVFKFSGQRWEGEVTLRPYSYSDLAEIKAFILKLRGRRGTFLYGDPDYLARGPLGSGGGTPKVAGASQTGNTLTADGFPAATNNVLRAGDYIQLGTGANAYLYAVVNDVNSDSSGNVSIDIEPALRASPADNLDITITGAKGVFKLVENDLGWQTDFNSIAHGITIAFAEYLTV